jgi:hypothetical protein
VDLETARDQLFAAVLERFVETRAELAAELVRSGQKDDAKKLKGIRRPSVSAWATNQVVRLARDEVTSFFDANDHLRGAQHAMMSGQIERTAYQSATESFREATNSLGAAIRETLEKGGRSVDSALVERVISNFRVAAVSEERRAQVLRGQLENDVAAGDDDLASVFGAVAGGPEVPFTPRAAPVKPPQRAQEEEARRRLEAARDEESAAEKASLEAAAKATEARAACDRARELLDEADRTAAKARQDWRDAQLIAQRADREAAESKAKLEAAAQRREAAERRAR